MKMRNFPLSNGCCKKTFSAKWPNHAHVNANKSHSWNHCCPAFILFFFPPWELFSLLSRILLLPISSVLSTFLPKFFPKKDRTIFEHVQMSLRSGKSAISIPWDVVFCLSCFNNLILIFLFLFLFFNVGNPCMIGYVKTSLFLGFLCIQESAN